jgi:hypothetical protein
LLFLLRRNLRCLLAPQHPSRVIYPDFKGLFPTEINQRAEDKYFSQYAHCLGGWQSISTEVNPILLLVNR